MDWMSGIDKGWEQWVKTGGCNRMLSYKRSVDINSFVGDWMNEKFVEND